MIVTGFALFLLGTAVSAGPYIPSAPTEIVISKNRHSSDNTITEYYPSSGQQSGSPFISNFIQKGTNVFFKPQFMLSAAQMPPQIQAMIASIEKDDCKTSLPLGPVPVIPLIEEPLRIVEKEMYISPEIKEVIEINPMTLPQPSRFPGAPLVIEEPCLTGEVEEVIIPKAPVLPAYIPRIEMPIPSVPTIMEIQEPRAPVVIPPAPVLPPMEFVPQPPMILEEVIVEDVPVAEIPVVVAVEQPQQIAVPVIPPAPVLPPFEMPKLSVLVEEAKVIPCPPSEESHEITSMPILPMVIPEAPVLPPYVPLEIPTPVIVEEPIFEIEKEIERPAVLPPTSVVLVNSPEPCDTVEILEQYVRPVMIPEAPVLPPYVPLEIPSPIIEIEQEVERSVVLPPAPVLPSLEIPMQPIMVVNAPEPCDRVEIVEEYVRPMVIPEAPVLPPYVPSEIPIPVIVEEPVIEIEKEIVRPAVLPPAPVLQPLELPKASAVLVNPPEPCDTVEIVEEYVRPVMIPEAPVLPPYVPLEIPSPVIEIEEEIVRPAVLPAAPRLPSLEIPMQPIRVVNAPEPCDTVEFVEEHVRPMVIPEAPVLPSFVPLEIPVPVIEKEIIKPALPTWPAGVVAPCPPEDEVKYQRVMVEQMPVMSMPFAYPELSLVKPVVVPSPQNIPEYLLPYFAMLNKKVTDESVVVENNSFMAFPKDCAHDVVVEHILPKGGWK